MTGLQRFAATLTERFAGLPPPAVTELADRLTAALAALIPMESFHRNVSDEKRAALRQQALDGLIAMRLLQREYVGLGDRACAK